MSRIVLDTDVASLLFKDQLPSSIFAKVVGRELAVTFVTAGELSKWAVVRRWGFSRRKALDQWLACFLVLPAHSEVGRNWGDIVGYAQQRGRPLPVNDSWIAAVCLTHDLPLATLNTADFHDLAEHEGLEIITG